MGGMPLEACEQVVQQMYGHQDAERLLSGVRRLAQLHSQTSKGSAAYAMDPPSVKIFEFQQLLLFFQLRITEHHLKEVVQLFGEVDRESYGYIDAEGAQELLERIADRGDVDP